MAKKKAESPKKSAYTVEDLIPDSNNANRGTQRGMAMLEQSLRVYGAGRSVLVDRDNKLIAGNKTAEVAADIGISDVEIVETDGNEIIAVRRTDLDMDADPTARELGLADNRVGQVNLEWEPEVLAAMQDNGVDMTGLWLDHELDKLLRSTIAGEDGNDPPPMDMDSNDTIANMAHVRMVQIFFPTDEIRDRFYELVGNLEKVFATENTTDTVWTSLQTADDQIKAMKEQSK